MNPSLLLPQGRGHCLAAPALAGLRVADILTKVMIASVVFLRGGDITPACLLPLSPSVGARLFQLLPCDL